MTSEYITAIRDILIDILTIMRNAPTTPQNGIPIPLPTVTDQGTQISPNAAGSYIVPQDGRLRFQMVGLGTIASIIINGTVLALNGATGTIVALPTGAGFEFEVEVLNGDNISFSGATVFRVWSIPGG